MVDGGLSIITKGKIVGGRRYKKILPPLFNKFIHTILLKENEPHILLD
jgi:hypothetical protein